MARRKSGEGEHFPVPHPRRPTDIPSAVLFIVCVLAMGVTIGYSWVYGDSRRLTHGFDFKGRLCGVDPEVAHLKYLYYCGTQGAFEDQFPKKLNFDSKTCIERCPTDNNGSIDCLMHAFHNFTELPGSFQHNLTFVVTLNLEITQSVTKQMSYPTRPFRSKYCVPQWRENHTLMEDIMNGPLRRVSSLTVAAGSFRHAWPVVLGSALLAVVMGVAYLHLLRSYAGPLIFASLCVGTVLFALIGLFFLLGILFNPWDQEGGYQHVNPLFRSFYGLEAKAYSVIVGACFLAASVCLAFTTWQSTERIDESIGIIHAACDCIFAPGPGRFDLLLQPLVQGVVLLVFIVVVFLGFMLACSVGYIDDTGIIINDEKVKSLRKDFKFHWWWKPILTFYVLAAFWVLEFIVAIGHFTVSYAVCLWYFTEIEEVDSEKGASRLYQDASTGQLKRIPKVRVHGVDSVPGGERAGFVEKGPRGDVLVVPIGKKGPYGMDFIEASHIDKKEMKCGATLRGFNVGLLFHTGSLALGAVIVTLTRPCRWVSHTIKGLLGKAEEQAQTFHEERTPSNMALAGFSLLSTLLEGLFGGYSKNAYAEMVLSSSTFFTSAHDSLDFLSEVGGVVAFLHGSTALYEMIGVVCIAMICGGLAFCLLQISAFQDQNSGWFVSNPWMMTVLASGMASLISFSFMSLFNVTADTLLYVFAWSRKHHPKNIETYCPHSLKQMVGQELVDVPEQTHLRARSKGGMKRLQHAAKRYAGTIMSTLKGQGAEQRPLLLQGGFR